MQLLDRAAIDRDVLATLYRADRTGQSPTGTEIIDRLTEHRPTQVTDSTVYEALTRLTHAGYVEATPLGQCKRYSLTAIGRQAIVSHLHALNHLCR